MNNDTISLLQECSAGANMAMSAIDQVLEGVENPALRDALTESRRVHDRIGGETRSLLRAIRISIPPPAATPVRWPGS